MAMISNIKKILLIWSFIFLFSSTSLFAGKSEAYPYGVAGYYLALTVWGAAYVAIPTKEAVKLGARSAQGAWSFLDQHASREPVASGFGHGFVKELSDEIWAAPHTALFLAHVVFILGIWPVESGLRKSGEFVASGLEDKNVSELVELIFGNGST